MKILAMGDFHGKFPDKLKKEAKNVDLILCVGDLADTSILRKLEFKHWNEKKPIEEIVGEKRYRKILEKTIKSMDLLLKKLKSLRKRVITIYGNSDILDKEAKKYGLKGFETKCKRIGITLLKTNIINLDSFTLAGFSGYRGAMSKYLIKIDAKKKKKIQKFNKNWQKRLKNISKKIGNKNTIFLAHDVPRGYFDKVMYKKSPMNGKHVGDEYFTEYIKKYQPQLFLCGHMHEYQGLKKLGKTSIINVGDGAEGKGTIIELNEGKVKKIKFIR
jgi:Icc-related predicted phosphoesterase